ncbi:MAG: hypothetical protein WAW60_03420 [Candidatus Saccharimonadales bacterium]
MGFFHRPEKSGVLRSGLNDREWREFTAANNAYRKLLRVSRLTSDQQQEMRQLADEIRKYGGSVTELHEEYKDSLRHKPR